MLKAFALLAVGAHGMELTKETWDEATAGKTVFVKFLAPWWGHCKRMKPAWDDLMEKYKGNPNVLIADVDCTTGGKSLCSQVGVSGYPTIKHGDPADLQDYKGGRDASALEEFAATLGPTCGPGNLDLCDDAKKEKIAELIALGSDKRQELIKDGDKQIKDAETGLEKTLESLQAQYEKAKDEKEATTKKVKDSGLGLVKAVEASEKKKDKTEL